MEPRSYQNEKYNNHTNNICHQCAKCMYRTITFFLLIRPCYPDVYTTITVKSYTHMPPQRMILSTKAECTLVSCRMSLTIHGSATSIWKHDTLTVAKLAWNDPKEVQHTKHSEYQMVNMSPTDNLKLHSPCPAC